MSDSDVQDVRLGKLEGEMAEVNKLLFKGNGHPAMTERITRLEESQKRVEQSQLKQGRLLWWILGTAATSVLNWLPDVIRGVRNAIP